jgi:small subunit ribosomal protein S8
VFQRVGSRRISSWRKKGKLVINMSMDRVSNMLSALKNASMAKKGVIEMVHTKECESIAKVLKGGGFLSEVKTFKPTGKTFKMLRLGLEADGEEFKITNIKRVSKPGLRVYKKSSELHAISGGDGVVVVSTSRGVFDGREAKKKKLGGEVICEVF